MNAPVNTHIVRTAAERLPQKDGSLLRSFRLAEDADGIGKAGETVMLSVLPSDTADQLQVLDTYISGYKPFQFTADLVTPPVLVDREKGKRLDRAKESAFERVDTAIGRQGQIKEIQDANTRTDYATLEYGLAAFVPWASENDAVDNYPIREATAQMLQDKVLLDAEVRKWNYLTTLTNWASSNRTTLGGTAKWDTGSAKNIRLDIQTRCDASAQLVTDMWMNPTVAFWFLGDTDVRAYLRQFLGDSVPPAEVARAAMNQQEHMSFELFGMPRLHICPAKVLTSGTLGYILADDVLLTSMPPGAPSMFTVASTLTFRNKGKSGVGWVTNEYLPNGRGLNGGRMLEVGFAETTFIGSNIAGGLIKDVLA